MGKKFDIMQVATQVGAGAVAGAGAGLAVDNVLPQLHDGYKGLSMLGLSAVAAAAGAYFKQPIVAAAAAGIAGAAGDRMQRHWIGGGAGSGSQTPTSGVGEADYTTVVDSEVQDYPLNGVEDGGGVAAVDDNGGVA